MLQKKAFECATFYLPRCPYAWSNMVVNYSNLQTFIRNTSHAYKVSSSAAKLVAAFGAALCHTRACESSVVQTHWQTTADWLLRCHTRQQSREEHRPHPAL